jgi:hypothetical protein
MGWPSFIFERVGEGMVSTIGSANTHKNVLENPDHISKNILSRGLDAGTAYDILSIDISDVDVGENIGAKLQIDQANADKQIAQAKAEEAGRWPSRTNRRCAHASWKRRRRARGHGGSVPEGRSRCHGLLPHAEHPGGFDDAGGDCRSGQPGPAADPIALVAPGA